MPLQTALWVPVLTAEAGLCLTPKSWHEANVEMAVFYLDTLLFKPGIEVLHTIANWAHFVNWTGQIVINASKLIANKDGIIMLRSPYNGTKISIDYGQMMMLIKRLKPNQVILPPGLIKNYPDIWREWDSTIVPYLCKEDLLEAKPPCAYGVYIATEHLMPFNGHSKKDTPHPERSAGLPSAGEMVRYAQHDVSLCLHQLITELHEDTSLAHIPYYIQGAFSGQHIRAMKQKNKIIIESEAPINDGFSGLVYNEHYDLIDLKDSKHSLLFEPINASCACYACSNRLTKAYLHHLYANTPLLCQRFLIQHNAWVIQNGL